MLEITDSERLFIDRRRLGETQKEAAKVFGVSFLTYSKWERGLLPIPFKVQFPDGFKLTELEICVLLRKRKKLTQKGLARKLNFNRRFIELMENGNRNPAHLLKYWGLAK